MTAFDIGNINRCLRGILTRVTGHVCPGRRTGEYALQGETGPKHSQEESLLCRMELHNYANDLADALKSIYGDDCPSYLRDGASKAIKKALEMRVYRNDE